jgi:hypothetical protein
MGSKFTRYFGIRQCIRLLKSQIFCDTMLENIPQQKKKQKGGKRATKVHNIIGR